MPITAHMELQEQRSQHLFIVRLWQEADAVTATVQWRGLVKHVLSEQNHYFTHLPDLLAFINTITQPVVGNTPTAESATLPLLGAQLQPEQGQQHTDKDHNGSAPDA